MQWAVPVECKAVGMGDLCSAGLGLCRWSKIVFKPAVPHFCLCSPSQRAALMGQAQLPMYYPKANCCHVKLECWGQRLVLLCRCWHDHELSPVSAGQL